VRANPMNTLCPWRPPQAESLAKTLPSGIQWESRFNPAGNRSSFDYGGGLVGRNDGAPISDSYATGTVSGGQSSHVGGLIGGNEGTISFSYSTGVVSGEAGSFIGGLIGDDESQSGSLDDTYWDTDTSGITNLNQGAGNIANDPGITGLTTVQFQSGLPAGFDPKVWAEKANLNGGLPYLLANPPPRR
ncbi:MAG: GLUG motif-containing protein, partial [Rhizomicrobium sp.]